MTRSAVLFLALFAFLLPAAPPAARAASPVSVDITPASCSSPRGCSCEASGAASDAGGKFVSALQTSLSAVAGQLEDLLGAPEPATGTPATEAVGLVPLFMRAQYELAIWVEDAMAKRWQDMWDYQLLPGMQALARQVGMALDMQDFALQLQSDAADARVSAQTLVARDLDEGAATPGDCVACSQAGELSRASGVSRLFRGAWERDNLFGVAKNNMGTYANLFCYPGGNGGGNTRFCRSYLGGDAATYPYYNADVAVTGFLYNKLTIDAAAHPEEGISIQALLGNMLGNATMGPLSPAIVRSPAGQQQFVERRSLIARLGAARAAPQLVASWRMPGSAVPPGDSAAEKASKEAVDNLRLAAGLAPGMLSANPSYKEILHAVSVDRFNSGAYAADQLAGDRALDLEKVSLSAFYLMQLRDYYELLERTALTLAVQVSVAADGKRLNRPAGATSLTNRGGTP